MDFSDRFLSQSRPNTQLLLAEKDPTLTEKGRVFAANVGREETSQLAAGSFIFCAGLGVFTRFLLK